MDMLTGEQIAFLLRAKRATYAGHGAETPSSRPSTHDLRYSEGGLLYIDTYLGGERFSGEEALWIGDKPVWAMNYTGRTTGTPFSGDFLKDALSQCLPDMPYRGPEYYTDGSYEYRMTVKGDVSWFDGYETIEYKGQPVYELTFNGGKVI